MCPLLPAAAGCFRRSSLQPGRLVEQMDTTTINRILGSHPCTRRQYIGCFASDSIKVPSKFPAALVVNLDRSDQPGSHWTAIYVKSPSTAYYFDSFGLAPIAEIDNFLKRYVHCTSNTCLIQSFDSSVCGHYCIFFIYFCCRGFSYERIISILKKVRHPDVFVASFVRTMCHL